MNPNITPITKSGGSLDVIGGRATYATPTRTTAVAAVGTPSGVLAPAPRAMTPQQKAQVNNDLQKVQEAQKERLDMLNSPLKSSAEIEADVKKVTEGLDIPTAPNMAKYFEDFKESSGISQLEQVANQLQTEYEAEVARTRNRRNIAMGEQVGMDVIGGRVSEVERQGQEQLDFIGREIGVVQRQLNSQYQLLDTMMNLQQMDYTNAMQAYQTTYNQRMDMYKMLRQEEQTQFDRNMQVLQFEKDSATANLQIYMDMITNGFLDMNTANPETKLAINKLEVQSGLGVGFLDKIKPPPGQSIKSITTRTDANYNQYADIIKVNADGSLSVESVLVGSTPRPKAGGGGGSSKVMSLEDTLLKQEAAMLKSLSNPDVKVVVNSKQRLDAEKYGEQYQTREQFISKLVTLHPDVPKENIMQAVYGYYKG